MTAASLRTTSVLALAALAVLTGCAPTAPSPSGGGDSGNTGGGAASGCDTATSEGWDLMIDPALSTHPENGVTFGDGSTLEFTYDEFDPERSPTFGYDLGYIQDDGAVIPMGGAFFDNDDVGNFSTSNNVFDSNAFGRYGFMSVSITQDASFDGDSYDAENIVLGVLCVKFEEGQ